MIGALCINLKFKFKKRELSTMCNDFEGRTFRCSFIEQCAGFRMGAGILIERMAESNAPTEQYERLGLPLPSEATPEAIRAACITETPRGTATREANGGGSLMGAFVTNKGPMPISESMMKHLRPGAGFGPEGAKLAPQGREPVRAAERFERPRGSTAKL